MADNEGQEPGQLTGEPVYEVIGPGWNGLTQDSEDDHGWAPQPAGIARQALSLAAADWLRSLRTVRFWLVSAAVPVATSAAVWFFLAALGPQEDAYQAGSRIWTYLLAAALMPAAASFLALHWGIAGLLGSSGRRAPDSPEPGPLAPFFAVTARGAVVAALALILLQVQAGLAGVSGWMAWVSAGVVALEFVVFGAIGAGASALRPHSIRAAVLGWSVAGALVAGNAVAVWALMPAVRADEPVSVAMNITRTPDGIPEAYECAPELSGTAEVFHTERIVWLLAANPVVLVVMFAGDGGTNEEGPGWMSGSLQVAADGMQVPCVNAEPRTKDAARMPLEATGLAIQGTLAGAFLAGGLLAARRRAGGA